MLPGQGGASDLQEEVKNGFAAAFRQRIHASLLQGCFGCPELNPQDLGLLERKNKIQPQPERDEQDVYIPFQSALLLHKKIRFLPLFLVSLYKTQPSRHLNIYQIVMLVLVLPLSRSCLSTQRTSEDSLRCGTTEGLPGAAKTLSGCPGTLGLDSALLPLPPKEPGSAWDWVAAKTGRWEARKKECGW